MKLALIKTNRTTSISFNGMLVIEEVGYAVINHNGESNKVAYYLKNELPMLWEVKY